MRLGVLGGQSQQRCDAQRDPGRNGFRFDPERNPRHDDNQCRRDVGVEQMVAQPAPQIKHHRQAGEVPRRVLDRTVRGVVVADVQLGELDLRIDHQRIGHVPDEYQILNRVGYCGRALVANRERSCIRK